MKKTLTLLALVSSTYLFSQIIGQDTLLFAGFEEDPIEVLDGFPEGDDTFWITSDVDGFANAAPAARPGGWFSGVSFSLADGENRVMTSNSWTTPPEPIANYLISPPIQIVDNSAMLYWKSAPFQTPFYLDGYVVLISKTQNFFESFTDTVAVYAEYTETSGDLTIDTTFNQFSFSNGFVFGLDQEYIEYDGDSLRFRGILRPDSASLAAYAGETIYIAFVHNSTDDNLLSLDEVLVTGTMSSDNVRDLSNSLSSSLFPNPAIEQTTFNLNLPYASTVSIEITDITGKLVYQDYKGMFIKGMHSFEIPLQNLSSGNYVISAVVGNYRVNNKLIKK